ncbi:MAG: NAD(P)/FAD-dependent oxidoreductase, partial [Solirubrobacterales bacterium]|nr:NAD(P)/FAD-dependent oxidoreductase [Solirubrobacterales bacterium]
KYLGSTPIDQAMSGPMSRTPLAVQSFFLKRSLRMTVGRLTDFGLPEPDHDPLHAHPTVSSDLIARLGHGDLEVKPNIDHFDGSEVVFTDGSSEQIDLVIYCTGYRITFPFLDDEVISADDNRVDLYRRVASIEYPGLYFIGLIQPLGAIMPLAEAQSAWVADLIEGKCALPDRSTMAREVAREQARMKRRYVASKRHTIQVDFDDYRRLVEKERRESRVPAAA